MQRCEAHRSASAPSQPKALACRLLTGIAARSAADPDFLYKVFVECGIDAVIIVGVNYGARDNFFDELEFVGCQVRWAMTAKSMQSRFLVTVRMFCRRVMPASQKCHRCDSAFRTRRSQAKETSHSCVQMLISCSNDFALVYLLSPAAGGSRVAGNALARALQNLPPHVFGSGLYTTAQRIACFCWKSLQYGIIGFSMGVIGSSAVNGMTDVREMTDETFEPPSEAPSALLTGLGWLYFMGISSNVRYNLIACAEQIMYRRQPGNLSKLGSIALRLTNNFAAAYLWVDLADEIGVQQPRRSLREERRRRERRAARAKWLWWQRKKPEPSPWPWRLLQPVLPGAD